MTFLKRFEPLWLALVIIGGLNWAIVALFDTNVVSQVCGTGTVLDVAYCVMGFAALMFVPRLVEDMHLADRMHAHSH
jgi:uncharacterized membrane protein YuzA (DUF378 family)